MIYINMQISDVKKDYYLISKTVGFKFSEYRGNAIRILDEIPEIFDEVVIGNRNNPKEIRRITTFKDKDGVIKERIFDYWGKSLVNKLFDYKSYIIGENEWVDKVSFKEFIMTRSDFRMYKRLKEYLGDFFSPNDFWRKGKTRYNYISDDIQSGYNRRIVSSVMINPRKKYETHEFVEYAPVGTIKPPKRFNLTIDRLNHNVSMGKNVNPNLKKDKFIELRAYDIEDAKVPMTERFIRDRHLEDAELVVNPEYIPKDSKEEKSLIAFFTDSNGTINFNKFYNFHSKARLARTAAHETEHAWQWFLDARNTGGNTPYTQKIYKKFGPLMTLREQEEAQRYTDSIDSYISYKDDFEKYKQNYIEILARKKGEIVESQYESNGKAIRREFPHIPFELL